MRGAGLESTWEIGLGLRKSGGKLDPSPEGGEGPNLYYLDLSLLQTT